MDSGRVNQKRRTRAAIVDAARELVAQGVTPTVAYAAEAALVSRTTAYRYFPTQESLLLELAVNVDVDEIEELVALPLESGEAEQRLLTVLDLLNRHVLADEVGYRTMLRLYLDLWLSAAVAGDDEPVVREGRRRRWIDQLLVPLVGELSADELRRVTAALSLVMGAEAMVVLRDVARLDPDEALDVARWAARAILRAALEGDDSGAAP